MLERALPVACSLLVACLSPTQALEPWTDITSEAGLENHPTSRIKFSDLNNDGQPDIIVFSESRAGDYPAVYIHQGVSKASGSPTYTLKTDTGLPNIRQGDTVVFADLDNDGNQDAIIGRYLDIYQDDYQPPTEEPTRTGWLPGNGDGSFSSPHIIETAQLATTRAIAVGDVNADGLPDLFLGNWYERYFSGYEAFSNDLLLQYKDPDQNSAFARWSIPNEHQRTSFDQDLGGRPTYGTALPRLDDGLPYLLELNYGRRWNRLYQMTERAPLRIPPGSEAPSPLELKDKRATASHLSRSLHGDNLAAETHIDGDEIRHGIHPKWPPLHAEDRPRSTRPDEPPFRANGNTFDAAIGDIDNDGDFDLFLSTIIHAWAGDSSDRSRFLVNQLTETGKLDFTSPKKLNIDRIPEQPSNGEPLQAIHTQYNQGDIYAELADLNNDGRLDLILCSSDYPDPPPHDERLRIYLQSEAGIFVDSTQALGINHVGAGMPSLGDIDDDGDLDLLVGQSFNRLSAELRRAAATVTGVIHEGSNEDAKPLPSIRLFRNETPKSNHSLILKLTGDPERGATRDAFGTLVRVTADIDGDPDTPPVTQIRQVLGPYGHSGKQQMISVHIGLGKATAAESVEILWSGSEDQPTRLTSLTAGKHSIHQFNTD